MGIHVAKIPFFFVRNSHTHKYKSSVSFYHSATPSNARIIVNYSIKSWQKKCHSNIDPWQNREHKNIN